MKKQILFLVCIVTIIACKKNTEKPKLIEPEVKDEWSYLFDGKTFDGWHIYQNPDEINAWIIEDSALVFTGKEAGNSAQYNLVTDNNYTNFILSLEWKISEGGNSGVMWGVNENEKYKRPYETGPEIQVLDNEKHPDAFKNPKFHQAGALYDLVQPSSDVCKPAGEWNLCEILINHKTNQGSVTLNGTKIVEFPLHGDGWDDLVANSKFKEWAGFGFFKTGKICLQDHGDKVWYRNIKIKEL